MSQHELTPVVDASAGAVRGVRRVFTADRNPIVLARQVTTGTGSPEGLSAVRDREGELEITVSVELDGSRPAAETAADVAAAVRDAVGRPAAVHVRVSRVADRSSTDRSSTAEPTA